MADFGPIITAAELADLLHESNVAVIDCRFDLMEPSAGRQAWRAGHVPSARYVDLNRDLSSKPGPTTGRHPLPDAEALSRVFARAGVGSNSRVVVYDAGNGGIAARAWWSLKYLGHDAVALLERGFAGWLEEGYAVEGDEPGDTASDFTPGSPARRVVTTEELVARLGDSERMRLVDAREAARYRGEQEPIDHTAGRIPGALSLPFTDLLDADGRFLDTDALRRKLSAVLGEDRSKSWTAMCGSGVTACQLAIAAELAGYAQPSLYVGSFSEWIQDPDRPVDKG
jgi:thiosulfate/3-mercaptopyruvate sulfurtransferase